MPLGPAIKDKDQIEGRDVTANKTRGHVTYMCEGLYEVGG
jgi:hypothetical protein